ncbi:hypothetical protein T06_710 [Trichinella sp. T6]|nr:hypothetical protein T06_710 [Trichinella sp. T6]
MTQESKSLSATIAHPFKIFKLNYCISTAGMQKLVDKKGKNAPLPHLNVVVAHLTQLSINAAFVRHRWECPNVDRKATSGQIVTFDTHKNRGRDDTSEVLQRTHLDPLSVQC